MNDQTYHFFRWVCASGQVDTEALVAEAFRTAEANADHSLEEDIRFAVRDRLAERLEQLLAETAPHTTAPEHARRIGDVDDSPESLWIPIFASARLGISCPLVAEALLIQAGRWVPNR